MPRLWSETLEAHRREVRDAIVDTTVRLAGEHGPLNVTMSQIADETGIGRATLYKYFAGVEQILQAWHEDQISGHLALLSELAGRDAPPEQRLVSVLRAYARIQRQRASHAARPHGPELAALLHRGSTLRSAEQRLHRLVRDLVSLAAADGAVRSDVSAAELATFCLHALGAAGALPSTAATKRLLDVVLDGLHPRR